MKKLNLSPCTLGEAPLWHAQTNEFVFADIVNGRLFAAKPDGSVRVLLQTHWKLGAFLFTEQGDLLLFTEEGVFFIPYGGSTQDCTLAWKVPMQPGERFNDAICDPAGRMLAGTKTEENQNGSLWIFERNHSPRRVMQGLQISNGMGFAENGTVFYHTDSGKHVITRYQYDISQGSFCNGTPFFTLNTPDGAVPDGMTVDSDGNVWTACWGGSCLRCINSAGAEISRYELPAVQVSSLAFGGSDLRQLLVTSAACGMPAGNDGGIWLLDVPFTGKQEYCALL